MIKNHPIEPEELMAYLDGELSPERTVAAGAHLDHCAECQSLAAELRGVSQNLKTWDLDASDDRIAAAIAAALDTHWDEPPKSSTVTRWLNALQPQLRSMGWIGAVAATLLVVGISLTPNMLYKRPLVRVAERQEPKAELPVSDQDLGVAGSRLAPLLAEDHRRLEQDQTLSIVDTKKASTDSAMVQPPTGPMIIRTAGVNIISKDFDTARARIEEIVRQHHGYVGELNVNGTSGTGRTLQAALRIPANELDAALAEVKKLGRAEGESQNGQDVTSQYVDLQARLTNARNTEQRLIDLLRERTGKLSDVLAVETELARVRGEIEQMEAERKTMLNQVTFATLNATITEDYQAQLQVVPPSTSTRLVNAAVDGYRSMVDGLLGVTLFLLSAVPSLLLWTAILFFPARFAWKKLRGSAHPI